jgi:aryl-alcohol dehydrogenase-like predicted oxidoreductase
MTFGETWGFGSGEAECRKVFERYVSLGGNFVDTANKYQEGKSEEMLGKFMKEMGIRDDIVLATKYSLPMLTSEKAKSSLGRMFTVNSAGNARKNLFASVDASLERLQTHYIDLLYVHLWDFTMEAEPLMRALDDLGEELE